MFDDKTLSWFERHGLEPPKQTKHDLTPDDIGKKLEKAELLEWRQEGNKLICKTNFGELVNFIPTDMIMTGTGPDGLPTFKKV